MNGENAMLTVLGALFLVTETAVRLTRLAIAARTARRNAQARAAKEAKP